MKDTSTNQMLCIGLWHIYKLDATHQFIAQRGVEQLAARRAHNPKVPGSSPGPATKKYHLKRWCFCIRNFKRHVSAYI